MDRLAARAPRGEGAARRLSLPMSAPSARHIHVSGVVQGVGFRPFIYGLAQRFALTGWVMNTSSGVEIEVQGEDGAEPSHAPSPPKRRRSHALSG